MDNFGGFGLADVSKFVKRKRSIRPRHSLEDYQYSFDNPDSVSKAYSEENSGHVTGSQKEISLDKASLGASYAGLSQAETATKTVHEGRQCGEYNGSGISKFKKVRLKVGGVTRTINTQTSEVSSLAASSLVTSSDFSSNLHTCQDGPNDGRPGSSRDQGSGMWGIPWKDFSKSGLNAILSRSLPKVPKQNVKQIGMDQSAHKSKRAPKKRLLGEAFHDGEEDDDDEIRYLEKLRTSRLSLYYDSAYEHEDANGTTELQNTSMLSHQEMYNNDRQLRYDNSKSHNENMKALGRASDDVDFIMEGESLSDDGTEVKEKQPKENHVSGNFKGEMIVSTRQRALKRGVAISFIEFPNGLPPAPYKKQKEKLSEVEQQLKKAEAAQKRKMQTEKAAREAEAEAIRKILGQDSTRKKQEAKLKKHQEELAQKRAANSILSSSAIRWTIRPSGTIVTFPDEIGLPSIFESKHCSYPLPRENCAGPSCTNAYKYRDSKSKLPLCSLQCYRALNEKIHSVVAS